MTRFAKALITGASSGLGRAIALELARRGTRTFVLIARREDLLSSLAAELRDLGTGARTIVLDVAQTDDVIRIVREEDAACGGFDLVLANAGIGLARPMPELEWDDLKRVLDVNTQGAIATLFAALSPMLVRNRGTLAGMSSQASQRGLPGSGSYSASKAALSTWLETLRLDLAESNVRVVDIRPGFVKTPMTEGAQHPQPFLVELEPAARRCVDDLERGRPVSTFPWPMAVLIWIARRMPDGLFGVIARRWRG